MVESMGLEIIAIRRVRLTKKEIDIIWAPCVKEKFYKDYLEFLLSGDCVVFIARGENAINKLDDLIGHFNPSKAKEGTIRQLYGISLGENVIHSTNDETTFFAETSLFYLEKTVKKMVANSK